VQLMSITLIHGVDGRLLRTRSFCGGSTSGEERSSDEGSRLAKNGTGSSRSGVSTAGPKVSREVVESCLCDLDC
jgi:hypothetical protein